MNMKFIFTSRASGVPISSQQESRCNAHESGVVTSDPDLNSFLYISRGQAAGSLKLFLSRGCTHHFVFLPMVYKDPSFTTRPQKLVSFFIFLLVSICYLYMMDFIRTFSCMCIMCFGCIHTPLPSRVFLSITFFWQASGDI